MKKKVICYKWIIGIFVLMWVFIYGTKYTYAKDNPKSVVILNSYHKGLSWTDQQTEGIIGILNSGRNRYSIAVEYMDWKHYPTQENLNNLLQYLEYKYSLQKIDLVITTDDAALEFALKNRASIFTNAPVVFSGVNENGVNSLLKGYSQVTGVVERVDPYKTVKVALDINPDIEEIYLIFDNTESGLSTGELTIEAIQRINPNIKISTLNEKKLEDILKEVGQAPRDSIILISTYYTDVEGKVTGFEDFCKVISDNTTVPLYHLYDFGLGHGAIGGSMLSGRLQGEAAARKACRVLEGENIEEIPVSIDQTTRYIFDYNQLTRFNVPKDNISEEWEIINKPFSFFETYRSVVITTLSILVLLVSFIFLLLFYIRKLREMKQVLHKSHEDLTKLYKDLEASDEKLKKQYSELVRVQQNLTSSERQYSLLFEKMLNGFYIFEPVINSDKRIIDIRFVDVNPSFENQTKIKASDILGQTWRDIFGFPNQDLSIYQNVLQTGEAERFETYYSEVDTYYLVSAFKVSDQQVGVVFDNISEYKMAIKEIKTLNEELEHRVVERTRALQEAINELEAFSYTVSHDLKSPLRAIDGYSRIIFEDFSEKLGEEATELLQNIRSICKDMMEMIAKLLQYSTTSRSAICKEEISIKEIAISIFNELKLANPERDIRFIVETGLPNVYADRILLKQVIYNVLSNAVKFTKDRKQAVIVIGNTITEEEYIFYVKDNGVGFNMQYSGKLFGIFQRLHTSDEFEGTGIGLVTVKKIIQKHGGRTWITGEREAGATVYFTLPFYR
jgi:signal transduction histidine kinase/ABC-type uncharacterized transport system substrate-binding protein